MPNQKKLAPERAYKIGGIRSILRNRGKLCFQYVLQKSQIKCWNHGLLYRKDRWLSQELTIQPDPSFILIFQILDYKKHQALFEFTYNLDR